MKKSDWKERAKVAERETQQARDRATEAQDKAYALRIEVDQLTRELEDVRLVADISAFRAAMRKSIREFKVYNRKGDRWLEQRAARIRRMHSAYGRRRGRGRW